MYIYELTESKQVSIRSIVTNILRLTGKADLSNRERAWLEAIAKNDEVEFLISQKVNKGRVDVNSDHLNHHWLDDLAMYAEALNALHEINSRAKFKRRSIWIPH
jgi:hypothetical protein